MRRSRVILILKRVVALERDVELEKRKNRDLQDASRERDKEYQKLKAGHFFPHISPALIWPVRLNMIE